MRNYTIHTTDGAIAWDKELHEVANLAPAKVLNFIERLSTTHNINLATRVWQELLDYDDQLAEAVTHDPSVDEIFERTLQFLRLVDLHIRLGDEIPIFLLGDYLNLCVHDNYAYDKLNSELRSLNLMFDTGKYDNVADASTDFFVAVHSTYYAIVV